MPNSREIDLRLLCHDELDSFIPPIQDLVIFTPHKTGCVCTTCMQPESSLFQSIELRGERIVLRALVPGYGCETCETLRLDPDAVIELYSASDSHLELAREPSRASIQTNLSIALSQRDFGLRGVNSNGYHEPNESDL